jgi:hypothetical protein
MWLYLLFVTGCYQASEIAREEDAGDNAKTEKDCIPDIECEDSEDCEYDLCLSNDDALTDLVLPEGEHLYLKGVHSYRNVVIGGTFEVEDFNSGKRFRDGYREIVFV